MKIFGLDCNLFIQRFEGQNWFDLFVSLTLKIPRKKTFFFNFL
jgi:hypothetical protein